MYKLIFAVGMSLLMGTALAEEAAKPSNDGLGGFRQMDGDGDGKVSQKEFIDATLARARESFKRLDDNADGFVTEQEVLEARNKSRELIRKRMEMMRQNQQPGANKQPAPKSE